jgi:hypothetical protein
LNQSIDGHVLTWKTADNDISGFWQRGQNFPNVVTIYFVSKVCAIRLARRRFDVIRPNDFVGEAVINLFEKFESAHETHVQPAAAGEKGHDGKLVWNFLSGNLRHNLRERGGQRLYLHFCHWVSFL